MPRFTKNRSKHDCGLVSIANLFKFYVPKFSYREAKPFLVKFFDYQEDVGMYAGHFDYMFKHAKLPFQLVKKRKNVKFNTIKSWLTPSKTALIGFYSPEYTHICLAVQVKDDRLIIANYGRKAPALKAIDEAFFNTFMGKNVVYFVKKKDIALLPKKR